MFIRNLNKSVLLYFFIIQYNSIPPSKLQMNFSVFFARRENDANKKIYIGYYYESTGVHAMDKKSILRKLFRSLHFAMF